MILILIMKIIGQDMTIEQPLLFSIPEHARIVTSFGARFGESFIVRQSILPGVVILASLKYPGYTELGWINGDSIRVNSLFPHTITNGCEDEE